MSDYSGMFDWEYESRYHLFEMEFGSYNEEPIEKKPAIIEVQQHDNKTKKGAFSRTSEERLQYGPDYSADTY